ncbi:MAG TPA: alcohol dehydrogenase catalytic domain-containing protein [Candidatus Corynebacterium gallistercoris]|uniref:Alcohol dehydrogenase catalytic domain-containing protein n=1 Tax=Candidatus Corynebacterium gallistercoris TaxID=2838530 RepID=A0A9D1RZX9_9CORY|nr:alcohol dehydrogenase catalytic domain-containing protein [Candidatus Corynebacterium gallistercoris]
MATAQVWLGGQDFALQEFDLPQLGPGELLVRIDAATVCGSDRHTVSGRRPEPHPSILGHEGVGHVVGAGPDQLAVRGEDIGVGARVVWSVIAACAQGEQAQKCPRCARGLSAKCEHVLKTGHEPVDGPWALSGTYATHIVIRAGQKVVDVPPSVTDEVAATAECAIATAMAAKERQELLVPHASSILVSGAGMLGLAAVIACCRAGADGLVIAEPDPQRRQVAADVARRLGCQQVEQVASADEVADPVEATYDFSGVPAAVSGCVEARDIGGVAVLAGSVRPTAAVPVVPEAVVPGWKTITGVHNYEPHHLEQAVELLEYAAGSVPWEKVITGPVSLNDLPRAFQPAGHPGGLPEGQTGLRVAVRP